MSASWRRLLAPVVTALATMAIPAQAQAPLYGHFDNNKGFHGLAVYGPFAYLIPADTASGPLTTFNGNDYDGLYSDRAATDSGATVIVAGGQFDRNTLSGLDAQSHSTITVTGGEFANNHNDGIVIGSSTASISGGRFIGNADGLFANNSTVTVTGGQFSGNFGGIYASTASVTVSGGLFSGNSADFLADANASMDIYGQFAGMTVGQVTTLAQTTGTVTASFIGTLQNDTTPAQTFTYLDRGATIRLHDVTPAPEPSQPAAISLGVLGLAGLALKARRRKAADA